MSRKKRHPPHENHERWLVSYADFITLLFAFFVVLYASSQVDKKKMGQLANAIEQAFHEMGVFQGKAVGPPSDDGGGAPVLSDAPDELARVRAKDSGPSAMSRSDLGGLKHELELALAPEIQRREIGLHIGPEGLVISLREIGFFNSGSANLRPGSEVAFGRVASLVKQYQCRIRVEGHTDNIPIHNPQFASNWELSTARATEVIRKLIIEHGFTPERLSAAGYAEFHPAADNKTEEGRRTNRRIDLVILGIQNREALYVKSAMRPADE